MGKMIDLILEGGDPLEVGRGGQTVVMVNLEETI